MIIKNNYNKKSVDPLDDYKGIGRGSHSLDKELEDEKKGFIRKNMNNKVLQNLKNNHDPSNDKKEDKWKFFR